MKNEQSGKSAKGELHQLVSFRLGEEEFAVDILKIQEIIRMMEITCIPKSPDFVEGVINLRGNVVPIIDLRKRFALPSENIGKNTRIIVMDVGGRIVGFIVDAVSEVLRLPASSIEPAPSMIGGIDSDYISGVGKLENRLLILLNVCRVFDADEIEMIEGPRVPEQIKNDDFSNAVEDLRVEKTQTENGTVQEDEPGGPAVEKVMEHRGLAGVEEVERKNNCATDDTSGKVEVPREDLQTPVEHVKGTFEGATGGDLELYGELGELAKYINDTKKGLRLFDAAQISEEDLPEASGRLEAIVASTEEATDKMLAATEEILEKDAAIATAMALLKEAKEESGASTGEKIDAAIKELEDVSSHNNQKLMSIMEACNFLDLTGQRIEKIIALVNGIENKLMKMILSFNIKK
ncbi:MAG: protein phosphatase CheZ [Proteobacteria bacterium]|nr:protein phosphatase CheZ [Pseudomonadota bacterium]